MTYTYYDYLEKSYEEYYEYYYEYSYWPSVYGNSSVYNGTYPPSPYEYIQPYNMDLINPILFAISIICAILSIIIGVITFYKMYIAKRLPCIIIALTFFCLFSHIILNTLDPISYYAWFINFDPSTKIEWYIYIVWDVFWVLSKISLYILFMYRYYIIYVAASKFNKHMLLYSSTAKYIIFSCFIFITIVQIILISMYMRYYYAYIQDGYNIKSERLYLNFCWSFLMIDLLFVGLLSYLLIRSIIKLIVDIDNTNHEKDAANTNNNKGRISIKTHKAINLELSTINSTITNMEQEISTVEISSRTVSKTDDITNEKQMTKVNSVSTIEGTTPETVTTTSNDISMENIKKKKKKKR